MKHALTLLLSLAAANVASAAIVISSASPNLNGTTGGAVPYTISSTTYLAFSAVGTGKLIVAFGSRATNSPTLTYGGVALIEAVNVSNTTNNGGSGAIYYLDNPTVDGDLVFTAGVQNSYQVNLYFVTGLAAGGPALTTTDFSTSSATGITLSLTTGSSGGFVIASGGSNGAVTPTLTSGTYNRLVTPPGSITQVQRTILSPLAL